MKAPSAALNRKPQPPAAKPGRQLPVLPVSPLPPLYARWMDELLAGPIPKESEATCDECAMLSPGDESNGATEFFNPQTKCCAYEPTLPNFLVGAALADDDPAAARGGATVLARLRAGLSGTPLGLSASPVFQQLYPRGEHVFGRSEALRCPHYLAEEGGRCGVWRQRNAVCSTWFCKYVRGAVGMRFWQRLRDLLMTVENELARWCVLELEVGSAALLQLFPLGGAARIDERLDVNQLDGRADPQRQRALWGAWYGREEKFFRECARLVNRLTWSEILAVCGPAVRAYARLAVEAYRKLIADELPARLKVGEFKLTRLDAAGCLLDSYNGYDPIQLSPRLMNVLRYFDGRPTAEARHIIAEQERVRLNDALVRRLVDFEILVPCD